MRTFRPITVTLPVELADMVKAKVASGEYASESAVIIDSLHALVEKDASTERWLREEAAFAYDAHKADPTRAMPLADAIAILRARIAAGRPHS